MSDNITDDEPCFYHLRLGCTQSNGSWIGQGQSPRTVVRRGRYKQKSMFSISSRTTGAIHLSYVDGGKTIDANTYIEDCLKPVFYIVREQRPKSGLEKIKFRQDLSRPHVVQSVLNFLDEMKVGLIDYSLYSFDLALSDFGLFDYIKKQQDYNENA